MRLRCLSGGWEGRALVAAILLGLAPEPGLANLSDLLLGQGYAEGKVFHASGADADFIKVEINQHVFTFLIDTGATYSVISRSAAQKAGLPLAPNVGSGGLRPQSGILSGANGDLENFADYIEVRSFRIGGVELAHFPRTLLVADIPGKMEEDHVAYDGVLGLSTMQINHVLFGFDPAIFFFLPYGPAVSGVDGFLRSHGFARVTLVTRDDKYMLPVTVDGTTAWMILDSGTEHTVISGELAQRAHLPLDKITKLHGESIDGHDAVSHIVQPRQMGIGPLQLPVIPLTTSNLEIFAGHSPLAEGLLGFDLIARTFPLLDTTHNWLYLVPKGR
jgi:predicted aspartyl protease